MVPDQLKYNEYRDEGKDKQKNWGFVFKITEKEDKRKQKPDGLVCPG